ncbi:hypothetical protein [Pontibacillus marinus]|nr:hypothetical protein [Pontibacillus marinus]
MFYLMVETFYELVKALNDVNGFNLAYTKMSLGALGVGILIEWKGLKNIFLGYIKVNLLMFLTIPLLVITFIPPLYWIDWYGLGGPFYKQVLQIREVKAVLTVVTGILLVRSLNSNHT